MFKKILPILSVLVAAPSFAVTNEDINNSFFPYASGVPTYPGLSVGMEINSSNADQFKEIINSGLLNQIKNGETSIKIGETLSFDLHPAYIEATKKYAPNTKLGDKNGVIEGSTAGRPFPIEPQLDDPRAGEKIAWNFKYGFLSGDAGALAPAFWVYRNKATGKVERKIAIDAHFLSFARRTASAPGPVLEDRPGGTLRAFYNHVHEPADVRNTQLLLHRYEDDLKRDNAYIYLGFQRRVRRLSTGQVTDAYLGSDVMIEDFESYNGRITDMQWTFKGTKNMLLPMYKHNEMDLEPEAITDDGFRLIDFAGQGGCYPKITYQLRKVYVLESDPVDPNHPISKRIHYVDAQTYTIPTTEIFDRKGDLWKTWTVGKAHPEYHLPINKGSGAVLDDGFSMIDVQANHCTTGMWRAQVSDDISPVDKFTVQNLRTTGR